MAWQIAVVRVVQVFRDAEDEGIVKLIELVMGEFLIVLDAIAIKIEDASFPGFASLGGLDEGEVFGTLDVVNQEGELVGCNNTLQGGCGLNVLGINFVFVLVHGIEFVSNIIDIDFNVGLRSFQSSFKRLSGLRSCGLSINLGSS